MHFLTDCKNYLFISVRNPSAIIVKSDGQHVPCRCKQYTCFVCKVYGSETIGPFVQGSKTFRKPSLKAQEKSDGHINN